MAGDAEVVKTLTGGDPSRRVLVMRRQDGLFELRQERWYQDVYEGALVAEGWAPAYDRSGVFAAIEIAEREAKDEFPWLSE